jgi:hypothetical protein
LGEKEVLTELYLATLSRPPDAEEIKLTLEYVNKTGDKTKPAEVRKAWEDVLWALVNTKEFVFRH